MHNVPIDKDHGPDPTRSETPLLLLLGALSLVGLLMWVGIVSVVHWSLLIAWTALGG
jgi:hypothetical protein